jgi:hypothetical protein
LTPPTLLEMAIYQVFFNEHGHALGQEPGAS